MRIDTNAKSIQFVNQTASQRIADNNHAKSSIAVANAKTEAKAAEKNEVAKPSIYARVSNALSACVAKLVDLLCCCFKRSIPNADIRAANILLASNPKTITEKELETLSPAVRKAIAREQKANKELNVLAALKKVVDEATRTETVKFFKSCHKMNDKTLVTQFVDLPRNDAKIDILTKAGIARAERLQTGGIFHKVDRAITLNDTRMIEALDSFKAAKTPEEFKNAAADLRKGLEVFAKEQAEKAAAEAKAKAEKK